VKIEIHPKYFKTTASCACGAAYDIGSTKENIKVDICSACHPLFTGKQKLLDAEGRVQKFKKKYAGITPRKKQIKNKKTKKSPGKK
jgi:large subunit ribosomal protein L31